MPETGIEPVRNFVAADFKSATSTNSVIPAPKRVLRTLADCSSVEMKKGSMPLPLLLKTGAGDESRTRDLNLGKVALYQLSYSRRFWRREAESNRRKRICNPVHSHFAIAPSWSGRRVSNSRPQPWQGCALPTELLPHLRSRILHRFLEMSRVRKINFCYPPIRSADRHQEMNW